MGLKKANIIYHVIIRTCVLIFFRLLIVNKFEKNSIQSAETYGHLFFNILLNYSNSEYFEQIQIDAVIFRRLTSNES